MAFLPYKYRDGAIDPWELMPAGAGLNLHVGTALKIASGKLAIAKAAETVEYICMMDTEAETADGQMIPVIAVNDDTIYETTMSAQISAIAVGDTYQLDSAGEQITATKAGAAKVVSWDGTEAGSTVQVALVPVAAGG